MRALCPAGSASAAIGEASAPASEVRRKRRRSVPGTLGLVAGEVKRVRVVSVGDTCVAIDHIAAEDGVPRGLGTNPWASLSLVHAVQHCIRGLFEPSHATGQHHHDASHQVGCLIQQPPEVRAVND